MAKIGTSPYLDYANHLADGAFVSAHVDQSLAAVVQQVGGTYWAAGVATSTPGNLDATNFASAGFANAQKAEPYSTALLSLPCDKYLVDSTAKRALVSPLSFEVSHVLVACTSPITADCAVTLYVQKTLRATIALPHLVVSVGLGSYTVSAFWAPVAAFPIYEGDVVLADATDAWAKSSALVTVSLWGRALHVGAG